MRFGERAKDGRAKDSFLRSPAFPLLPRLLLILVAEGQEFAVGPFIRGNLSRRWASGINSVCNVTAPFLPPKKTVLYTALRYSLPGVPKLSPFVRA